MVRGAVRASRRQPADAATRSELATRGVETADVQTVTKGVELSATTDPDGNAITLIGDFRVRY